MSNIDHTNGQPGNSADHGRSARITRLHGICCILSQEQSAAAEDTTPSIPVRQNANPVLCWLTGLSLFALVVAGVILLALTRTKVERVPDYRWGARYDEHAVTDALAVPEVGRLYVATRGGGLHSLDLDSRFFRHHTSAALADGLLSDQVLRVIRSGPVDSKGLGEDRLNFLCEVNGSRGLCQSDLALKNWRTILGIRTFKGLDSSKITGVGEIDKKLWVATAGAGIGIYDTRSRDWAEILTSSNSPLLHDKVRDLLVAKDGAVWIATDQGINRVVNGNWDKFKQKDGLAGNAVRRLHEHEGALWYVTAAGGLGRFDGNAWSVLASETGWGQRGESDVQFATPAPAAAGMWLTARDGSAVHYDGRTRTWHEIAKLPAVPSFLAAGGDLDMPSLWLASPAGVQSWNPQAKSWSAPFKSVTGDLAVLSLDAGSQHAAFTARRPEHPAHALLFQGSKGWRKVLGDQGAGANAKGLQAAYFDADLSLLFVGTNKGLSIYDPATRDWIQTRNNTAIDWSGGGIRDLHGAKNQLWALNDAGAIFSRDENAWRHHLGGGKFSGDLKNIHLVDRDSLGRLWIVDDKQDFHLYDPKSSKWKSLPAKLPAVTKLAASAKGIWALAGGAVYRLDPVNPFTKIQGPGADELKNITKIFAAGHEEGLVALDKEGRVFYVSEDAQTQTIVGDPAAKDFDWSNTTAIGVVGHHVILGGPESYRYDALERSWQKLDLDPVVQIVPALDKLWLRTKTARMYRFAADLGKPIEWRKLVDDGVENIAGSNDQLLVAFTDGSVKRLTKLNVDAALGGWESIRAKGYGPKREDLMLELKTQRAVAEGDHLYVLGARPKGKGAAVWHFHWPTQAWQLATDEAENILEGATALAKGADRLFVLVGASKEIRSCPFGKLQTRRENVADSSTLRTLGDTVAVTSGAGMVHVWKAGQWTNLLQMGGAGIGNVRDILLVPDKDPDKKAWVFAGDSGAFWMPHSLGSSSRIAGNEPIDQLFFGPGDHSIWGWSKVKDKGKLFHADMKQNAWKLASNEPIRSFAIGAGDKQNEHWACFEDGTIKPLTAAANWRSPVATPANDTKIVAVKESTNGFLLAFEKAGLAEFVMPGRTWRSIPLPAAKLGNRKIIQMLSLEAKAENVWVLFDNGELYFAEYPGKPENWNWKQLGDDRAEIVALADSVLIRTKSGALEIIDSKQQKPITISAASNFSGLGKIVAAAELPSQVLVLSDGAKLAAYDPNRRTWTETKEAVLRLHPLKNALLAETDKKEAIHLSWDGVTNKLQVRRINANNVDRLATNGVDGRFLAVIDGRLRLQHVSEKLDVGILGQNLPPSGNAKISQIESDGDLLYLLLDNGSLYRYSTEFKEWSTIKPKTEGDVKKIAVAGNGGALWLEIEQKNKSRRLIPWPEEDLVKIEDPLAWHACPAGIVAVKSDASTIVGIYANRKIEIVATKPGEGPERKSIKGYQSGGQNCWFRLNEEEKKQLWLYHAPLRSWQSFNFQEDKGIKDTMLDGAIPLVLTKNGKLWRFTRTKVAVFEPITVGVQDFDLKDQQLVLATDSELRVETLDKKANIPSLIWKNIDWKPKSAFIAAAGLGQELWVVSDLGEVSSYDLAKRAWTARTAAPAPVERIFAAQGMIHLLGKDQMLRTFRDDKWQEISAVGKTEFTHQGKPWRVTAAGLIVPAEVKEPPAAFHKIASPPVRIAPFGDCLWLEMDDGTLWHYRFSDRQLLPKSSAQEKRGAGTGLVMVNGEPFWVLEHEGKVGRLLKTGGVQWHDLDRGIIDYDVLVHPDGLLVANLRKGTILEKDKARDIKDVDELAKLRNKSQPPKKDRLAEAKGWSWKLERGKPDDPAKLQWLSGKTWVSAAIDPLTGRLPWDQAATVLITKDHAYVATRVGVQVFPNTPDFFQSMPLALVPIPSKEAVGPLTLWVNDPKNDAVLVLHGDGQLWKLTQDHTLADVAPDDTVWKVKDRKSIYLLLGKGEPEMPISLKQGRLGIDQSNAVVWRKDTLLVKSEDCVCEYEPDLSKIRKLHPAKDVESEFEMRTKSRAMSVPKQNEPLKFRLDFGPAVKDVEVEYSGNSFKHDRLLDSAKIKVTSDGKRTFTLTEAGLVVTNEKKEVEAIHRLDGYAPSDMIWAVTEPKSPRLYLAVGINQLWTYEKDGLKKSAATWTETTDIKSIRWNNEEWQVTFKGPRAQKLSAKDKSLTLDLDAQDFLEHSYHQIGLSNEHVWTLKGNLLTRMLIKDLKKSQTIQLSAEGKSPRFLPTDAGILLVVGSEVIQIPDEGDLKEKRGDTKYANAFHDGAHWRVDDSGRVYFLKPQAEPLDLAYDPKSGFGCDQIASLNRLGSGAVLATRAGLFRMESEKGTLKGGLADLVPLPYPPKDDVKTLWLDSSDANALWVESTKGWYRLKDGKLASGPVASLPEAEAKKRNELSATVNEEAVWQRKDGEVSLKLKLSDGKDVLGQLNAAGRWSWDDAFAAVPIGDSVWLATKLGLLHVDRKSQKILALTPGLNDGTAVIRGAEFRRLDTTWFIQLDGAFGKSILKFDKTWQRVDEKAANPFNDNERMFDGTYLHAKKSLTGWSFKASADPTVKAKEGIDVNYLPNRGQFDFQLAKDAVIVGKNALVETSVGLAKWKEGPDGWEWAGLHQGFRAFRVLPLQSPRVLLEEGMNVKWSSNLDDWKFDKITPEERRTVAQSTNWRVLENEGQDLSFQTKMLGDWRELPLAPKGDFETAYAKHVVGADLTVWTASEKFLMKRKLKDNQTETIQLWSLADITGPAVSQTPADLFLLTNAVHVQIGAQVYLLGKGDKWEKADDKAVKEKRLYLWNNKDWTWRRSENNRLQAFRQGEAAELRFESGRFAVDQITDAAPAKNAVWLAADNRLRVIGRGDAGLGEFVPKTPPGKLTFEVDREMRQLYAVHEKDLAQYLPVDLKKLDWGEKLKDRAKFLEQAVFHDGQWNFGKNGSLQWMNLRSWIAKDGRFAHDHFQAIALSGSELWIPTPVGLLRFQHDPTGPTLKSAIGLPAEGAVLEDVSTDGDAILCRTPDADAWIWRPQIGWKAGDKASADRVLVDTPFWSWTRSAKRELRVVVKPAITGELASIVDEQGRFPFDRMEQCLLDGDSLWLAGPGGIVQQDAADGRVRQWYRQDSAGTPLPAIARLGRFLSDFTPVPSCAAGSWSKAAKLYAHDFDGTTWRFEGKHWTKADTNPWNPEGSKKRVLVRTPLIDISQTDGKVAVRSAGAGLGPMLVQGRMQTDHVHEIAFDKKSAFLATPAGVVDIDPADGAPHALWQHSAAKESLQPCTSILVHEKSGKVFAHGPQDRIFRFDPPALKQPGAWTLDNIDKSRQIDARVLYANPFWVWYRWKDAVQVHLANADEPTDDWPLIVNGRFSFDLIRDFRFEGGKIWAVTAGGVMQLDIEDPQPRYLHRRAVDFRTGKAVPLFRAEAFTRTPELMCVDPPSSEDPGRYERQGGRWIRKAGQADLRPLEWVREDQNYRWRLTPPPAKDPSQGFSVVLEDIRRDREVSRRQVLHGIEAEQLREVVAANGELWIGLEKGLYRVKR